MKRIVYFLMAACCWLMAAQSAMAQDATPEQCSAMLSVNLTGLQDASTTVTKAEVTKVYGDLPDVCQVNGKIDQSIGYTLAMPMHDWNGKFFQTGCGGACGTSKLFFCDEPLKRGYACLGNDMGHTGTVGDWTFGKDNLKALVDFGFRATHRATLAGKALVDAFYKTPPKKSYFVGCSTGGRQALMAAQKFPDDFDGIIAGSPAIDETGAGMQLLWTVMANHDKAGHEILQEKDVVLLHDKVVKQCDMNDGVKDGLIGDARQCHFDPAVLLCKAGQTDGCLTQAKVTAARKIYSGPTTSAGVPTYTGGMMPGSELTWMGAFISHDGKAPLYLGFISELFRNVGFSPAPGPSWQPEQFNWDEDYKRFGLTEPLFSANNPDLRKFKAHGGKMIGYQGWDDNSIVPLNYLDYYRNVVKVMDGQAKTNEFYRMFTVPGMRHCSSDGAGADAINYVEYLEKWVEQGQAPDMMIGYHVVRTTPPTRSLTFPLSNVNFTRPNYVYPGQFRYNGNGDPNDAANFHRVEGIW